MEYDEPKRWRARGLSMTVKRIDLKNGNVVTFEGGADGPWRTKPISSLALGRTLEDLARRKEPTAPKPVDEE